MCMAISGVAILGAILYGFDVSSMAAIIATPQYLNYFGHSAMGPSSSQQGGIVASMPGGSFVGSLFSGHISDRFGRRNTIMGGAVVWLVGSTLCCASQNIGMLVVGRFINGLSVGICSAQVPVYISEIAQPEIRGRCVGLYQWAVSWGILIMFYISFGCSYIDGVASFRLPWGLQMVSYL